jgi:peptidoglycan-N-acetylglucosamine deacetylase
MFEIGGHTLDHRPLRYLSAAEGHEQIAGCRKWLEDATGRPITCFSPPLGQFRRRQLDWVKDAGFTAARTTELLSLDWPRQKTIQILPTTIQAHPHKPTAYLRNAARRRAVRNFVRFAACAFEQDWVLLARRMLDRAIRTHGVFHLWGHSWEIASHQQWPQLEQVLRLLADETPKESRVSNGALCRATVA